MAIALPIHDQPLPYVARLEQAGKPVSLYVEPGGGHAPVAPVPRGAYAFLMVQMLHARLGGAAPDAPGAELQAYLRANLRLAGPEFAGLAKRAAPLSAPAGAGTTISNALAGSDARG